jgi:glycosyltransferase involved in cell wall biosynthesis
LSVCAARALPIGLFGRLIGIKLFYWNSGQGKALFEPWNGNIAQKLRRIRQEMRMLPLYAALQLAHRVVTGPERMGEYYIRHFGVPRKKILILHNEIDPEAYAASSRGTTSAEARRILGLPENVPLLLFVGRISKLKGSPYLLPVIERVAVKIPHFCAVLVGPNYEPDWPRRLESSPARDVILFVGPVPSSELPTYYCACDVVMLPSNSEGFPRTLLEAMAMSRPIVCFDVGGVVDILPPETHKDLIPLADVEAFSRRLVDLLTNPKECAQRGKQLRAAVNRFSMEAAADTIERKIANGLQCACYEDSADAP